MDLITIQRKYYTRIFDEHDLENDLYQIDEMELGDLINNYKETLKTLYHLRWDINLLSDNKKITRVNKGEFNDILRDLEDHISEIDEEDIYELLNKDFLKLCDIIGV
jgi:hypothetical protein